MYWLFTNTFNKIAKLTRVKLFLFWVNYPPLHFNLAEDPLEILVESALAHSLVGMRALSSTYRRKRRFAILQISYDITILFFLWKIIWRVLENLRSGVCLFKQMIALKVDFHSSEIFCIDDSLENQISNVTSVNIYLCLFTP